MSNIDIYIRDKESNIVRRVGDNHHDMLTINEQGQLCYHNLQNGGGCRTGEEPQDWYEFVPNEDRYGYNIDPIKICDVVESCEDCPKYADDCDGEGRAE